MASIWQASEKLQGVGKMKLRTTLAADSEVGLSQFYEYRASNL